MHRKDKERRRKINGNCNSRGFRIPGNLWRFRADGVAASRLPSTC